jgi:Xaa-Pro aminopeptidase
MPDTDLVAEKVRQAEERLADLGIDCWLTFVRETTEVKDPALDLVLGFDVVWETAVLVTPDGPNHVVIGRHDAPNAEDLGLYEVHAYDESIEDAFADAVAAVDPDEVALNHSREYPAADGLTHGLYGRVTDLLADAGYGDRTTSAEPVMYDLRATKTATEHDRIRAAAERTVALLAEMVDAWTPDTTEADVAAFCHGVMREEGMGSAWSWDYCPTVHAGGAAPVGHTLPGDRTVPPGELLHVDFGVELDGYCADLQRVFYHPRGPDDDPPAGLLEAHRDVRAAIDAAFDVLEPGVVGHAVDTAAREEITDRGWEEFKHAVGHAVGRNAHDAGVLLGPRWDRYGDRPEGEVGVDEVYTLELGVDTEWGYVGQEELVVVTDDGAEYLVDPQTAVGRLSP